MKTLHVSGIFCAHHQGLAIVHTAIGTLLAGYLNAVPTWLCLQADT